MSPPPTDLGPRFVARASSSGLTDLERATLQEQLPGPLLVWGVVEGGGDRTRAFDAVDVREAATKRGKGEDLWLFRSEEEISEAIAAASARAA